MTLTHLSLFSGIGGIDLAAEMVGFRSVGFCEIEPFPQKVLAKHWPGVPIFPDVCKLTRAVLEEAGVLGDGRTITLISGGVPCQPASVAGKRNGQDDDRWLWGEAIRVISEVKPTWTLLENVSGLITLDNGMAFDGILSDLEGIGYETQAFVIPACAVGAPHRRDRVFIVGHLADTGHEQSPRRNAIESGLQHRGGREARSESAPCGDVADAAGGRRTPTRLPSRTKPCQPVAGERDKTLGDTESNGLQGSQHSRDRRVATRYGPRQHQGAGDGAGGEGAAIAGLGQFTHEFPPTLDGGGLNANAKETGPGEILRVLRRKIKPQNLQRDIGGYGKIRSEEILQSKMCRDSSPKRKPDAGCIPETVNIVPGGLLPGVQGNGEYRESPFGRQPKEQLQGEYRDIVRLLSYETSLAEWEEAVQKTVGLQNLWQACKEIGYVPDALTTLQEVWQSISYQDKVWCVIRAGGGTAWPAGYGEPQYEWEPPRIAVGVKNRVARLKALGNAVVPAQVLPILAAIAAIERGEIGEAETG